MYTDGVMAKQIDIGKLNRWTTCYDIYRIMRKVTAGALVFTVFWKTGVFQVLHEIGQFGTCQKGLGPYQPWQLSSHTGTVNKASLASDQ